MRSPRPLQYKHRAFFPLAPYYRPIKFLDTTNPVASYKGIFSIKNMENGSALARFYIDPIEQH